MPQSNSLYRLVQQDWKIEFFLIQSSEHFCSSQTQTILLIHFDTPDRRNWLALKKIAKLPLPTSSLVGFNVRKCKIKIYQNIEPKLFQHRFLKAKEVRIEDQ